MRRVLGLCHFGFEGRKLTGSLYACVCVYEYLCVCMAVC